MSLDVYLTVPGTPGARRETIYIRRDGAVEEVSRAEFDFLCPGRQPVVAVIEEGERRRVYHGNITHNLAPMAEEADIYTMLWQPEAIGVRTAAQLLPMLLNGLRRLLAERARFAAFNPPNRWGSYDQLVGFMDAYIEACTAHPEAEVSVCV